jgi:outer membrane protein assembly factor BamC
MTTRKKNTLAPVARAATLTAIAFSLAACTTLFESDKVDYRGATKAAPLDVPPDLTQLQRDNRYAIPDGKGVATASSFQHPQGTQAAALASGDQIGPVPSDKVRAERNGNQRWLVVKQTPEQLWPQLKDFWHDAGFTIAAEAPATGTMETNWVENRAKIPQDFIRRTIGKVFDSAYSSGERDKFRTRLERLPDGSTEIYISHRGAEEVLTGANKELPQWSPRANDPGLEAEFLGRLMARLTGAEGAKVAHASVANAPVAPLHAKMLADKVEVDEGFDRAWRRVGLALDRVGFTVEDRDRVQGVYFVRYVDPEMADKEGFWSKLLSFGSSSDKAKEAQRYRVLVKAASGASVSEVSVQSNDGKPDATATGAKILKLLNDELK